MYIKAFEYFEDGIIGGTVSLYLVNLVGQRDFEVIPHSIRRIMYIPHNACG